MRRLVGVVSVLVCAVGVSGCFVDTTQEQWMWDRVQLVRATVPVPVQLDAHADEMAEQAAAVAVCHPTPYARRLVLTFGTVYPAEFAQWVVVGTTDPEWAWREMLNDGTTPGWLMVPWLQRAGFAFDPSRCGGVFVVRLERP